MASWQGDRLGAPPITGSSIGGKPHRAAHTHKRLQSGAHLHIGRLSKLRAQRAGWQAVRAHQPVRAGIVEAAVRSLIVPPDHTASERAWEQPTEWRG